jgi:cytochrome c553
MRNREKPVLKVWQLAAVFAALALGASTVEAARGNPERGREISKPCAACHGENGVSASDEFPIIAGQPADYLAYTLRMYRQASRGDKSGRNHAIMSGQAAALKDKDIADLAAFYSRQKGGVFHKR